MADLCVLVLYIAQLNLQNIIICTKDSIDYWSLESNQCSTPLHITIRSQFSCDQIQHFIVFQLISQRESDILQFSLQLELLPLIAGSFLPGMVANSKTHSLVKGHVLGSPCLPG